MRSALFLLAVLFGQNFCVSPLSHAKTPEFYSEPVARFSEHFTKFSILNPIPLNEEGVFYENEKRDRSGKVRPHRGVIFTYGGFGGGHRYGTPLDQFTNPLRLDGLTHCILWYKDEIKLKLASLDEHVEFRITDTEVKSSGDSFRGEFGLWYTAYYKPTGERVGSGDIQCWTGFATAFTGLAIGNVLYQFRNEISFF